MGVVVVISKGSWMADKNLFLKNGFEITEIKTAKEAQQAPSGYGVYSLVYNGKLLSDHYISNTRFKNILKKEI